MIYQAETGNARMLFCGETMLARGLTPFKEPDYLALVELTRNADLAFTNLETTVRNRDEGYATATKGTPMTTPPELLEDLKWMGFNLVSTSNNHALDYGPGGVLAMCKHLQQARLAYSGSGANLGESRMPGYVDTAAGRVGLVSATSTFKPGEQAGEQRPDTYGRPGCNPLRYTSNYTVDSQAFDALMRISDQLAFSTDMARLRASFYAASEAPEDTAEATTFLGSKFQRGKEFRISTTVDASDADANLRAIREAKRQADWVVFSFHNHEYGETGRRTTPTRVDLEVPADFMIEFSRAAIDAGADAVVGHGLHVTLGIEVYKNRPIFYSLGNHIFQNDSVQVFPSEAYTRFGLDHAATPGDFLDARNGNGTRSFPAFKEYWESYAAMCEFRGRELVGIRLHPVDLGHKRSRAQMGRPVIAHGEVAARVLDRVTRFSRHYGTEIVTEGETGYIRL